jgi:hypothetical protein
MMTSLQIIDEYYDFNYAENLLQLLYQFILLT